MVGESIKQRVQARSVVTRVPRKPVDRVGILEVLAVRIAQSLIRATADRIDSEICVSLRRVALTLGLDRSTLAEIDPVSGTARVSHGWARANERISDDCKDMNALLPWTRHRILLGETVVMSRVEDLPKEAAVDRQSFLRYGPKSGVIVPVRVGAAVVGAVSFAALHRERSWRPAIVYGLQTVAGMLGYGLERKRAVGELRRLRRELIYVSRVTTMGELAASMAHELNQPLAAILSNAEALQTLLARERPDLDEVRAGIMDIIQDDNRAGETIRRLRDLFRGDRGAGVQCDVAAILAEAGRVVRGNALMRNIECSIEAEEPLAPIVGEPRQVQQAIINLILNAFDAVEAPDRDGPREVRVAAMAGEAGYIRVLVRDSGKGITPEVMPRIFEAFFTTKPEGMGMGLAIARAIVEAHGGRLSASANGDRGTTFEITLPCAKSGSG